MTHFGITGAQVLDGTQMLEAVDVEVSGATIASIGAARSAGVEVIEAPGSTLFPGLIDAHTHADRDALQQALSFGVTTELDMLSMPETMIPLRRDAAQSNDLADVRSSSVGLPPAGGHPHQLRRGRGDPAWPTASRVQDVAGFVEARIAEGADYLKVLIEDGHVL